MHQGSGHGLGWVAFNSVLAAALLWLRPASAALLLQDSFSYPDGPVSAAAGSPWTTHSGTSSELQSASGRILISSSNTEDISAPLAEQPYDASNGTNRFYASFIIRCTTLPAAGGSYFAHFKSTGPTTFACRVWALTSGAAPGKFRIGLSSTSGSAAEAIHPADLDLNTDYRIATRLVSTNSVSKLWIDPTAESDLSVSTAEAASDFTVAAYAFRQAPGEGTLLVDDLRVGTTFGDVVTNALPQHPPGILRAPSPQAVQEFATAVFAVTATAVPPPGFQWRFNGTNLPGATNSSLVLTQVTFAHEGFYSVVITNALDVASPEPAVLNVLSTAPPAFSILNYNLHGNGVLNWSTNSSHVRAIGRQVQFLDPDILTLQEIPVTNNGTAQMENFVKAFRPGFYLATNSSDDLYIRSVIISRYPIVASRSWLHGTDLSGFGYSGSGFTRDLFEAEIAVPGFPQPLHVFTVHLKSGQDSDSAAKRSAEAGAISNYFVTTFLSSNSFRPYLLTGDMNEDIVRQPPGNPRSVDRLISATGLRLKTPFNSMNGSVLTFSIQSPSGPTRRYDYVLPCGLLASNIVSSELFRSDLLSPLPPNLFSNDTRTASDHLPVLVTFGNPFARPFTVAASRNSTHVELFWTSLPGERFRVEQSADLSIWTVLTNELLATGSNCAVSSGLEDARRFFRVRRLAY